MKPTHPGIRYSLVLPIALIWVAFQSAISSYVHGNSIGQFVANHLPLGGLFYLILLILIVNPLIRRVREGIEFSLTELILIWAMITAAAAVPGYGMMEFLFPYLAAPLYFATPENQWVETLHPYIPRWLYVSDARAVADFFTGMGGGSGVIPWAAWWRPTSFWVTVSLALFLMVFCWAAILRRQWVERERYAFPLVQVPVHLLEPPEPGFLLNRFLRNGGLWVGFGIAFLVHLLKGLHSYWPFIPFFQTHHSLAAFITERPWNALVQGWSLYVFIYFSVIGVTYFLQLDVALSLWFFFTLYKFQEVFFRAFGITGVSTQHQVIGGDVVLVCFLIWMARQHLWKALRSTLGQQAKDDEREPMSYRIAFAGFVASALLLWILYQSAGMSLGLSLLLVILLWGMATVIAWMVANAGMLLVNIGFSPFGFLTMLFGSRFIGPRNLAVLKLDRSSIVHWTSESLMPYVLQNFRLSDAAPQRPRKLAPLMLLSIAVAVAVAFVSSMHFIYRQGAVNLERWVYMGVGPGSLNGASYAIQYPSDTNLVGLQGSLVGAIAMGFLIFMRYRFLWWPLHPIGYVVGVTYAPHHLWFSVLAGWCIKVAVLKFGGFGAYRRYRPLFLGLILGEYCMAAFWIFVGIFTRVSYWGLPH